MKKFALAVVVIAFGALMVAGCPSDNKTNAAPKGNDAPATNAPATNG
jgi:outer membrane murein-binding lipoprotein Lpp